MLFSPQYLSSSGRNELPMFIKSYYQVYGTQKSELASGDVVMLQSK